MQRSREKARKRAWSPWYFLLLPIYVATLWVPFYNSVEPTVLGFPFFYAYQMIVVVISAGLTGLVFFLTR